MTESNVQGGFRGDGLLLFDPERVISSLDLKLKTLTIPSVSLGKDSDALRIAIPRWGKPEEVASLIGFLSVTSGNSLPVSGRL
jgi:NAD(P)-dependent dehydrogenase (short-subunit alcohol dehydrogenase family)